MDDSCDKYTFVGEWLDPEVSTAKQFLVHFFPNDGSISLFDVKQKRTFLKRTPIPDIKLNDFYIGGAVRVFGRLINIMDFACEDTRKRLFKSTERTFAMIKPISNEKVGEIIQCIEEKKFRIMQMKMTVLTKETAIQAFEGLREDQDIHGILDNLTSGPIISMELVSDNAISKWTKEMGNNDPELAEAGTLRKRFGINKVQNAVYGSSTADDALKELSYFFPTGKLKSLGPPATGVFNNCTCCIVKPHAIREGSLGKILRAIANERYNITALKMVYMENANAAEFYEVYKGVVPDYMGMIVELTSGPCVALEIIGPPDVNTPVEFRKLVGPTDPDIARQLRPHTLRARFGKTRLQNAVHCSDLPEDGLLEVEYFFKILD